MSVAVTADVWPLGTRQVEIDISCGPRRFPCRSVNQLPQLSVVAVAKPANLARQIRAACRYVGTAMYPVMVSARTRPFSAKLHAKRIPPITG